MNISEGKLTLLPPARDLCQECAVKHEPKMPHDKSSLYYQTKFQMEHGRSANWADAMIHCTEDIKQFWKEELMKKGIKEDEFVSIDSLISEV